ncbi:MAG: AAA family ATPase [Desulfosoma sp.]|uniref:AAA family ATPase n=1 Tax=Desulfosoma sp. TaxID=2603217 RepID=UPI0040490822
MIDRLVIENFMTHQQTVLELHPGVTVLTGRNNTGKSAIVEALRCVAENPASASLIRHGAPKAVVRLELDDGSWMQWERTAGSVVDKALCRRHRKRVCQSGPRDRSRGYSRAAAPSQPAHGKGTCGCPYRPPKKSHLFAGSIRKPSRRFFLPRRRKRTVFWPCNRP